jgi:phosphatidylglycerophosphate synthase
MSKAAEIHSIAARRAKKEARKKARKEHKRVNDILLGPLERPALAWLAARMPAWVVPDVLTGIGSLAALVVAAGYWLTNIHPGFLWLASFGFVLNWFGDSLDGTLARYRKIERPRYGFFIDHTVDALNTVLIVLGIGLSPYLKFELAAMALIGYLLLSILVYINTYLSGVFKITFSRLGPTEARAILILVNTIVFFTGDLAVQIPVIGRLSFFNTAVVVLTIVMFFLYVFSTIQHARELAKAEPPAKIP